MSVRVSGFQELQRKLRDMSNRVQSIGGTHKLTDILTPQFVRGCSRFESAEALFDASGFTIESKADFEAIPDDQWDEFIRSNTRYSNWKEMLADAGQAFVKKKMNL